MTLQDAGLPQAAAKTAIPTGKTGGPARICVVGGAGYVGSVLTRVLLARGYGVTALDTFLYDHGFSVEGVYDEPGYRLVKGDLRDKDVVARALEGVDHVVLLASLVGDPISKKYPDLTRSVNLDGSQALYDALDAHGIDRFVFTSTCSNYGLREDDSLADESSELNPLSLYAETKVGFERFVLSRLHEQQVTPTLLRIATAFGLSPRMRFDLTVNEFGRAMAMQTPLDVYDKDTWRPYAHVRDISAAILKVIEAPAKKVAGEVFNVGSDANNYTKAMLVEEFARHVDAPVTFVEKGIDARNYRVSFSKIRTQLGFEAQHSVAAFVPQLISAVNDGLFGRVEEINGYYGNYQVRDGVPESLSV
ncbi:UDP-glucose 4-epimerase [Candidatus Phaeomarinobacter ectocarpi]|uniref:UDP-glucose 4-epimerase n=1 Tax=Candidatus Phaeomarinibacter ectocarpi TaxID=1458461 RepID=X5MLN8_9HYPH|nr:NAD(P)-dependent oxidoreductase [Candidatus Phaeomarinobacter ectocarpi]CDO58571.1 UDP-glucose 4-epimerase [Candidatus Phaeomarinobacter ectocarpi]